MIGDEAFAWNENLKSVVVPDSVEEIGSEAFLYCSRLAEVTIGKGLKRSCSGAFNNCGALKAVYISDLEQWCNIDLSSNPLTKAKNLYLNGELVEELVIPETVKKIKEHAFQNSSIKSLKILNGCTSIAGYAFSGCDSLVSVDIPDSVVSIGTEAFRDCESLSDLKMSNAVKTIGYECFYACNSLTEVSFGNKLERVGGGAFSSCTKLKTVTIPKTLASIGLCAFRYCTNLWDVYYGRTITDWKKVEIDGYNSNLLNANIHYNPFSDVDMSSWYADAAIYCNNNGYISGTGNECFSPNTPLTRAQFVQILAKVAGVDLSSVNFVQRFSDIPSNMWFSKAVSWAVDAGITGGVGDGLFAPNAQVTRAQLAVFLRTYAEKKGLDVSTKADIEGYSDYMNIPNWARAAFAWAVKSTLISGTDQSHLSPNTVATRAQAAVIIKKLCENVLK